MNWKTFLLLVCAVAFGGFVALIVWTLIVKNQVAATVDSATANSPLATLLKI